MQPLSGKWRPRLWFVLGGALGGTLALSLMGLVTLRHLGPEIGFRNAAALLALVIGAATAVLWLLLVRLLLRPITGLAAYAAGVRGGPDAFVARPAHFGTHELHHRGLNVIAMAEAPRDRETSLRSFANHAVHELKTPVSVIRAATELLAQGGGSPAQDRALTSQIRGAGLQMQDQLSALRAVAAARETSHRGQACLDDLAGDLGAAHRGLDLSIEGGALAPALSRAGLAIVLGHLVDNAACHGAGRVALTASPGSRGPVLLIGDDGPGISAGNRAHVFAPFFTTRRDGGGTGMGLYIVAGPLRSHGADIALDGACGGAVFRITFPMA